MTTNTVKLLLALMLIAALAGCGKSAAPPPTASSAAGVGDPNVATRVAAREQQVFDAGYAAAKAKLDATKDTAAAEMSKAADDARVKADAAKAAATAAAARTGFIAKSAKALADLKPQVDSLREKGAALSPLAKAPFDALMKTVDTQWAAAAQGLTDLKAAPPETVDAKNAELDATLKKLADAVTAATKVTG